VVVGIRAAVSLEGSFVGRSLQLIGMEPYAFNTKVIVLRGDIKS